jgi:FG-GAP-like repeat
LTLCVLATAIALPNIGFGTVVTGDFNGDGHLDLADLRRVNHGLQLSVFLGNGDRTFQPPQISNIGSGSLIPEGIIVGDFNHDGQLDLAVLYLDNSSSRGQSFVTVLLGNGDGTFQAADTHQVAPVSRQLLPSGLAAADFNRDGNLDLLETNREGTLNVLLGNGDGTFQDPVALRPGVTPPAPWRWRTSEATASATSSSRTPDRWGSTTP